MRVRISWDIPGYPIPWILVLKILDSYSLKGANTIPIDPPTSLSALGTEPRAAESVSADKTRQLSSVSETGHGLSSDGPR